MSRDADMFIQIPDSVAGDKTLPYLCRLIYGYILRFSYRDGYAFASYNTYADALGVSRRSAIRAIKLLERKGLIKVERFRSANTNSTNKIYVIGGGDNTDTTGDKNGRKWWQNASVSGDRTDTHNIEHNKQKNKSNFSPSGEKEEEELSGYDLFVQWQKEHEPKPPAPPQWG